MWNVFYFIVKQHLEKSMQKYMRKQEKKNKTFVSISSA